MNIFFHIWSTTAVVAATAQVNVVLKCFAPLRVRQKIEVRMPNECHFRELVRRIEQNQHHLRAKYHCFWMLNRCVRRNGANKQFYFSGRTRGIVIACEFSWSFMLFSRCLPWKEQRDDQQFFPELVLAARSSWANPCLPITSPNDIIQKLCNNHHTKSELAQLQCSCCRGRVLRSSMVCFDARLT